MPTYAQLNQRNPSWNADQYAKLWALYEGGDRLARLYGVLLPQREREPPQRYQTRLKEAQYRNYLGPIVDYFKSMLFVSRPVLKAKAGDAAEATENPGPYWLEFREDCDRCGTDIDALFGQVLIDAMVCRTGWLRLHQMPRGEQVVTDAALFEQLGLDDVWLEHLDAEQVLDWDLGEDGRLEWAVTHRRETPRLGLAGDRNTIVETWEYLTRETVETYRVVYSADKAPKPDDSVTRLGEPAPHTFGAVPLACLDLPPALWVGNRLSSAQLAHLRKLNAQAWSLAATCYALREYFVAKPDEFRKHINGPGYEIILHKDDKAQWSSPDSGHFDALENAVKAEKDEIFRVAHQMALGVENNAAAVGRSAESKASDAETTRVVLVAFSRIVKETIEYTLDLIARARGEKLTWSVEGLDDFAAFDVKSFLESLELVGKAGGIPSRTFEVQAKTRTAEALLKDVDEATKQKIRKEIESGAADPVEQRELENAAALGLFGGSQGPERADEDSEEPEDRPRGNRGRSKARKVNGGEKPAP